MGRGGFALIGVLWLTAMLTAFVFMAATPLVTSARASENRVALARARWAARACLDLLRSRAADGGGFSTSLDSVPTGSDTWCSAERDPWDERINPNFTDSLGLTRILGDPVRTASLLDWIDADTTARAFGAEDAWYRARHRPPPRNRALEDPTELRLVRGFEELSDSVLRSAFTTTGPGSISPVRAPRWMLESISGLPDRLPGRVDRERSRIRPRSAEQLVALLGLDPTIPEFRTMVERLSFGDGPARLRVVGFSRVGGRTMMSELRATVILDQGSAKVLALDAR